jgi:hypothetical protein
MTTQWLHEGSRTPQDVCDVAAGFQLNDRWEFVQLLLWIGRPLL